MAAHNTPSPFNAELRPSWVRATLGSEEAPGVANCPALEAPLPRAQEASWTIEPQIPKVEPGSRDQAFRTVPGFVEAPVDKVGLVGCPKAGTALDLVLWALGVVSWQGHCLEFCRFAV